MKIAILGMGVSGLAALKLALKKGITVFAVNQGEVQSWKNFAEVSQLLPLENLFSEDKAQILFETVDQVVLSPGISATHPLIQKAQKKNIPVISEIEFASGFIHIPYVAVTGTNGKTTFCTLLAMALEKAGKRVFLGGNIGTALSELPLNHAEYDIAVVEVSSFQLETIEKFHPKVAMILNLSLSHGERYKTIDEYGLAKFNITKNLTSNDFFLYKPHSVLDSSIGKVNAQCAAINLETIKKMKEQLDFSQIKTQGSHFEWTYAFLKATLDVLDVVDSIKILQELVNEFNGLPHRLETVETKKGISFYNDSKSTNLASTLSAIDTFKEPIYLILGGQLRDKNIDYILELKEQKKKIKKLYLIGEAAESLYQKLSSEFDCEKAGTLEVVFSKLKSEKGIVLFSPAFPSFDQFNNYAHRGTCFKEFVKNF